MHYVKWALSRDAEKLSRKNANLLLNFIDQKNHHHKKTQNPILLCVEI